MFERRPASRAELEARKAFKPGQLDSTEYARAQKAFHENRERLKSARLAREAAANDSASKPKSSVKKWTQISVCLITMLQLAILIAAG
jgi:hypothetical protein